MTKADRIKELLKEKGLTQKDLCISLNISQNGLKKMFDNDSYKVKTLEEIAKYLDVEIGYLDQSKVGQKEKFISNAKIHEHLERGVCYKVPVKAFGGFLTGYEDHVFLNSLEKTPNKIGSGICFEFEIEGYSMYRHKVIEGEFWDFGYEPGSYVYATPLESGLNECRKGKDYVFQTTDGIIIKTFDKIESNKCFMNSINKDYNPVAPIPVKSVKVVYSIDAEFNKKK